MAIPETLRSSQFSPETRNSVAHYLESGNPDLIGKIVAGVLERFAEPAVRPLLQEGGDHVDLQRDLDFDSLQVLEAVIVIEEIFGRTIPQSEVVGFRTVGEINSFLRERAHPFSGPLS